MAKEDKGPDNGFVAVSMDVAQKEVEKWLDFKKTSPSNRETNSDMIEVLADAISEGVLVLDTEEYFFTQKFKFPIADDNGNTVLSELKYKPRITESQLLPFLKGVKPTDIRATINGYVCALTGQNSGMIRKLDTEDKRIPNAIAIFFL